MCPLHTQTFWDSSARKITEKIKRRYHFYKFQIIGVKICMDVEIILKTIHYSKIVKKFYHFKLLSNVFRALESQKLPPRSKIKHISVIQGINLCSKMLSRCHWRYPKPFESVMCTVFSREQSTLSSVNIFN